MQYEIGDGVRISVVFTNAISGALVNPSTVSLILKCPDGSEPLLVVENPTIGSYYADYLTTQPGVHTFRWAGAGAHPAASEGNFVVARSRFV